MLDIKELTRNIGKVFQSKYGKVIVFPHPSLVNKRSNVYIPITKLKEMVEQCQSVDFNTDKQIAKINNVETCQNAV